MADRRNVLDVHMLAERPGLWNVPLRLTLAFCGEKDYACCLS